MPNIVTPKLTGINSFNVKNYAYAGSTTSMSDQELHYDYEFTDYSYNPDKNKSAKTTKSKFLEGLHKAYSYVGTVAASAAISMTAGLIEDINDGMTMVGSFITTKAVKGVSKLQGALGYTEAAEKSWNLAEDMEKSTAAFVAMDWSEMLYDKAAEKMHLDEEIAHGGAHTVGNAVGTIAGYAAITVATAGTGTAAMTALELGSAAAAGSAAQKAFQNGATYNQAALNAGAAGAVALAGGTAMRGLGAAAKGATSLGQVAGLTAAGAATGAASPALTSAAEYNTYGKNQYSSYDEFAKATGTYKAMATGAAIGGVAIGAQAGKSYAQFSKEFKEVGMTAKEGRALMKESTDKFTKGSEDHPLTKEAMQRNKEIAKTDEYKALTKEVAKHGKTLQNYGAKPNPDPELYSKAEAYAAQNVAHAKEVEPAITSEMEKLQTDSRQLTGLDYKLKSQGSMTRKIATDTIDWYDGDMEAASKGVNDSIRYTMICSEENMGTDIEQCMTSLKDDGYKVVEFKNSFGQSKIPYKGINTTIESPDGTQFELQFHTAESFSVKEETTHVFYEVGRNSTVSTPYEQQLANNIQLEVTNKIDSPYLTEVAQKYPRGSFVDKVEA